MIRYRDEAPKAPFYSPEEIPDRYKLSRVAKEFVKTSGETVADRETRFRANPAGATWIKEHYGEGEFKRGPDGRTLDPLVWVQTDGDSFKWGEHWHRAPVTILKQVFSFDELCRLWDSEIFQSDLGEHIEAYDTLLWKVRSSLWHYGVSTGYNDVVDGIKGLMKLSSGLSDPDFTIKITYSYAWNPQGSSTHEITSKSDEKKHVWIDGTFGLMLFYKGEHVLTVGFSIGRHGIMVSQAQLRVKKGNRFLYRMPMHYLDWGLEVLGRAFGKSKLWLVTGESAVLAIQKSYGDKWVPNPEVEARVGTLYNRPLAGYRRTLRKHQHGHRWFVKLAPVSVAKTQEIKAAA